MYLAMIGRKTAALMACAAQMGGRLGALRGPGGGGAIARVRRTRSAWRSKVRDDLLGIWEAADLEQERGGRRAPQEDTCRC
jgi:hypothetical protein